MQDKAKKRNLHRVNEHFEPTFLTPYRAVSVEFQQPIKSP